MHSADALYDALRQNLADIELQIKHIKNGIALAYPEEQRDKINVWFWTQRTDGKYVLEDMLLAKAQVLNAMAVLKASSSTNKTPGAKRGNW